MVQRDVPRAVGDEQVHALAIRVRAGERHRLEMQVLRQHPKLTEETRRNEIHRLLRPDARHELLHVLARDPFRLKVQPFRCPVVRHRHEVDAAHRIAHSMAFPQFSMAR